MTVEGIGIIAPKPVVITIPDYKLAQFEGIAESRNRNNRYTQSTDAWKNGMTDSPIVKGLMGECALVMFLCRHGLSVKWETGPMRGGDGGVDIECGGMTIQVTTGFAWRRRFNSRKQMIPLAADIFVFAKTDFGNQVQLQGWKLREKMMKLGHKRPQGHFNIESEPTEFEPMHRLITLLM